MKKGVSSTKGIPYVKYSLMLSPVAQTNANEKFIVRPIEKALSFPSRKRNALSHIFHKKGSYTIEAAFVLPICLFLVIGFQWFFLVQGIESSLRSVMASVGEQVAVTSYVTNKTRDEGKLSLVSDIAGTLIKRVATAASLRSLVIQEWEARDLDGSLIDGNIENISFAKSRYNEDEEIYYIEAQYNVKLPFYSVFRWTLPIYQRATHRAWTGRKIKNEITETRVYVTETGTVYHTAISCPALSLSVREILASDLPAKRNTSGGIYKPCDLCENEEAETVFVTECGTKYHTDRNCSGLKRTVYTIRISEIGGRSLCKKCASRQNSP